jgi:hypothetical protein
LDTYLFKLTLVTFTFFHNLSGGLSSQVSVSAVISACEKAAEWEAAVHLLSQADDLAATVTFSAAISACEKAAEWRVACALLQQLRMAALQLDSGNATQVWGRPGFHQNDFTWRK